MRRKHHKIASLTPFLTGTGRNLAVADVDIEGAGSGRLVAGSGPDQPGTVGAPTDPMFQPSVVRGYLRKTDSEYKLFEFIGSSIKDSNAKGTVRLFTERNMCDSCASVADQFRMRFPNVNVVVKSGGKP